MLYSLDVAPVLVLVDEPEVGDTGERESVCGCVCVFVWQEREEVVIKSCTMMTGP